MTKATGTSKSCRFLMAYTASCERPLPPRVAGDASNSSKGRGREQFSELMPTVECSSDVSTFKFQVISIMHVFRQTLCVYITIEIDCVSDQPQQIVSAAQRW